MEYKYKAFISYRHKYRDRRVAKKLHGMIEEYEIPEKLRKDGQRKPGKVFLDRNNIGAANDLTKEILEALDSSEFLIVIMSKNTLESEWCRKEIDYFREHHGQEKVLSVLLSGDPKTLMEALMPGMPEQGSVDLRGFGFPWKIWDGIPRLCAALLDCEYGELVPSFLKRQREQILRQSGIALSIAAIIIGILAWSNLQIEGKNRELERQNDEILLRESELLAQEAVTVLKSGDRLTAMEKSVQALPEPGQERPFCETAEQVLFASVQIFWDSSLNYVFSQTALEQNTAIMDFCISPDGRWLTTADQFDQMTCFDTATGVQRWTTQIRDRSMSGDPDLICCEQWGIVLLCRNEYVAGVSQETGELLWIQDAVKSSSDLFVFQEDRGILAFISYEFDEARTTRTYFLTILSVEDGAVVSRIPIVSDEWSLSLDDGHYAVRFPSSGQRENRSAFFVEDGRFFTGTYYSSDGLFHCYVADLQREGSTELYSGASGDIYEKVHHISLMGTDSILVVRDHPDLYRHILLERISLRDGSILWQMELEAETTENVHCCMGGSILLGIGDDLYAVKKKTGEILHAMEMSDQIKDLSMIGDLEFTYLLSNGESTACWINSLSIRDTSWFGASIYDLGSCEFGQLWKGGSVRLRKDDSAYRGFFMSDDSSGGGYAAMVPQDNDHCVIVWRPIQIPSALEQTQILPFSPVNSIRFQMAGEEALVLYDIRKESDNDGQKCIVLDPATLMQKAEYTQAHWLPTGEVLFLPDGSGYLRNLASTIEYHDLKTGVTSEIWNGYYCPNASARLLQSGDVLSAAATERGIKLWLNGQQQLSAAYPQVMPWSPRDEAYSIHVGGNGMIVVSLPAPDGNRGFFVYDYYSGSWHQITTEISKEASFDIQIGDQEPIFLMMDAEGTVSIYDIRSESLRGVFYTGIPRGSLQNMLFCRNDTFLMVYTKDKHLHIFDAVSGVQVFSETLPWEKMDDLSCYEDRKGNLFIGILEDAENGYWISTDTWLPMALVPDMMLYNKYCDRILEHTHDISKNVYQVNAIRLPTTEEVIELVRGILN